MGNTQINFRSNELAKKLALKSDNGTKPLGEIARKELERYYNLIEFTKQSLGLTIYECCLVVDALNGTLFQNFEINPKQALLYNIQGAIALDRLDLKWSIDQAVLLNKLEEFSLIESATVLHCVEIFWGDNCDISDVFLKAQKVFSFPSFAQQFNRNIMLEKPNFVTDGFEYKKYLDERFFEDISANRALFIDGSEWGEIQIGVWGVANV